MRLVDKDKVPKDHLTVKEWFDKSFKKPIGFPVSFYPLVKDITKLIDKVMKNKP